MRPFRLNKGAKHTIYLIRTFCSDPFYNQQLRLPVSTILRFLKKRGSIVSLVKLGAQMRLTEVRPCRIGCPGCHTSISFVGAKGKDEWEICPFSPQGRELREILGI